MTAGHLADLVAEAARSVQLQVPAVDANDVPRRLVFGRQLDVRIVRSHRLDDDQALTAAQVAGYLAKYATKTAADEIAATTAHHRHLQVTIADLDLRAQVAALAAGSSQYGLLGHWGRMLGFRGHFATKSRRYSFHTRSAPPRPATPKLASQPAEPAGHRLTSPAWRRTF